MANSAFHDHLLNNLTANQMETLVAPGKINSYKRLNYILRKPAAASLDEVLFFSSLLDALPYSLLKVFDLGRDTLSARVVILLMKQQEIEPVMAT